MKEKLYRFVRARRDAAEQDAGVTLIELLAVIVILAVIASIAVPVVLNSINNAKINTTKQSESVIAEALNRYAADHDGKFPTGSTTKIEGTLTSSTDGGPYLQSVPNDAWGNPFKISSNGSNYDIVTSSKSPHRVELTNLESAPTVDNPTTNP
ncbi:hypothetical protein GCM10025857_32240 [Alicyclobacillus contaminans]|uniref:type II secretion system protein n=1 Tax=Alicyclobacillus contaminans TaxID=392016 RepID=UPI000425574C|nr:type II secretion system protein GspG [Alicyclobacillus contaminans]GMA51867.1 hypothetical protein GCM10025857_32240 [Alicyclobacillus contaminans]